ncbi:MAG: GerW family sporulation protein [Lachnospiraceae bacterium]|nr:GerW family sporulation protein [Lachnospiraceae bacterium]MBQ2041518.1 GerW family sporulation protein [Lachnospiraceae bacterium]
MTLQALFKGMEGLVQSKTVVGEPVQIGDATIVPLVEVSAGLASGTLKNNAKNNGAGAMSAKLSPVAMLIIQEGRTRLVNVKNQDVMTRLLDLIPEAIDKITKGAVSPEARAAAKDMLDKDDAEDDLLDHIEIVTANED